MQHGEYVLFVQKMGPWGIVLIVLVVLLLFGGKKIPELMKGLDEGVKSSKMPQIKMKTMRIKSIISLGYSSSFTEIKQQINHGQLNLIDLCQYL